MESEIQMVELIKFEPVTRSVWAATRKIGIQSVIYLSVIFANQATTDMDKVVYSWAVKREQSKR